MRRALAAAALSLLAANASATAHAETIGTSAQGRPIKAIRLGDPNSPRKALVVGAIHGDEPAGLRITKALRKKRITGVDLWVVDTVNPDGLARHTRQNARGVDLNRNFPFRWQSSPRGSRYYSGPKPLSEPESKAVSGLVTRLEPAVSVWYHQPWNAVLVPCRGHAPIQRAYARRAHAATSCRGDGLRGTAITWENSVLPGSTAFVVELAPGGISEATAERHANALVAAATGR